LKPAGVPHSACDTMIKSDWQPF